MEPLYYQIAQNISRKIINGELLPGTSIPSETQLVAEFKASKMTVRKGLSLLFEAGYLKSIPGKGYYVESPRFDLFTMHFNEMNLLDGIPGKSKLLAVTIVEPELQVREILQLGTKTKTVKIERLICLQEEEPVAYDIKYMPYDRGKPVVEKEIQSIPLSKMVSKHGELFSMKNEIKIVAIAASNEMAGKLKAKNKSPLLSIEQTMFSVENRPIGWGVTYCRPEFYQIKAVSSQYMMNEVLRR